MTAVLEATGLGKRYRVAHREHYYTIRDQIVKAATAPFRMLASLGKRRAAGGIRPAAGCHGRRRRGGRR